MNDSLNHGFKLPPEEQAIRDKCFHPSGTFVEFPIEDIETSIPARFEKIVRQYPHRLAIKMDERSLTYRQLNRYCNRIAEAILNKHGLGSEPIVLMLENAVDVAAAILGVLKAGKCFVLLDPKFPLDRIIAIFEDVQTDLVITNRQIHSLAAEVGGGRRVEVLECESIDYSEGSDDLTLPISPDAFAYITYTSGSTGQPKGVVQNHRNIIHDVLVRANVYRISQDDRLSLLAFGTSNAIKNIFYSLLNGSTLLPFDVRKDGTNRLAKWISIERVSICRISAPLFRTLCETMTGRERFPELRLLLLASDTIYPSDVELFKKHFTSECLLATGLSSSETGVLADVFIDCEIDFANKEIPIGYPVENREISLLNDDGKDVGYNAVGEMVVRSRYLSPGYWRRSELTEAKFKLDPQDPSKRLYFTGDLGLMRPNGCLIHKGRKDFRVKIRGFGVELGEIERTLLSHPAVKEAIVVTRKDESGQTRLVAYYTSRVSGGPTVSELRKFTNEKLPDYMAPSVFVRLDALPQTPAGKLDRLALPEPDDTRPELSTPRIAPRDDIEDRLVQVWQKVLNVRPIGINDNFFDLGGDSLSGSRLVSLIHKEFKFDLPVSEFFAAPTIAELARRIERAGKENPGPGKKAWTYLCELQRGEGREPVFIFPGGGGGEPEFFVYGFLARHVGTEYPFYGLRARGADGILQPHTSVAQMADAYVEEIRAIQPEGPYFLVGECAGGVNAYEAARQLSAQGQEIAMLVLMDVERPRLTNYFRFRAGRCLKAVTKFWIRRRWRENYYLARIPFHLKQLRSLGLNHYPEYFLGRFSNAIKPTERPRNLVDSPDQRAAIVLQTGASGQAIQHIEWVRENYRRAVRRFYPKLYTGHIEIIVSEKLNRHDPTLGWKKLALEGLRIHPVNGDHWSYIREHVAVAGLKLRECLERAEKERTSCST